MHALSSLGHLMRQSNKDSHLTIGMVGFIRNLVKQKKHNLAVSFIYAFKMEDDFPPEPLLKDYMRISKNAAGAILQNGHNSAEAQV